MAQNSGIEWTDDTWNPTVGCSVLSPGCSNCYAMKLAHRLERMGSPIYRGHTIQTKAGAVWNGKVSASNWGQMIKPLSWKKPRRIFVNSMSDLFHEDMPEDVIYQVLAVMALCPQHTFQVLTKRAARMRAFLADEYGALAGRVFPYWAKAAVEHFGAGFKEPQPLRFPLPNVHLGVSVEDQTRADERIPDLLETPAAVRFLSCEPLLGPVDLRAVYRGETLTDALEGMSEIGVVDAGDRMVAINPRYREHARISWVICGGESGPGARAMDPEWARSLRDQCAETGVAFFQKQMARRAPIPPDLMVREFPA